MFDRIPVVAERYLVGRGRKDLEVWKPNRQVRQVTAGHLLRVQAPAPFRLRWTVDEWHTFQDTHSNSSGLGIYFVDLAVAKRFSPPIQFTFFWTHSERWEGRNYEVQVR